MSLISLVLIIGIWSGGEVNIGLGPSKTGVFIAGAIYTLAVLGAVIQDETTGQLISLAAWVALFLIAWGWNWVLYRSR